MVERGYIGRGVPLRQAVVEAAAVRFRPIVMTSMAFLLGVVPLVLATGAGAESRRSIGTGAFGGVLAATIFGLVFAPVLRNRRVKWWEAAPLRGCGLDHVFLSC